MLGKISDAMDEVEKMLMRNPGFTGDGSVPSSSGRPLLNGPPRRLPHHTGPDCIIRD